jgi:hypothetical protein
LRHRGVVLPNRWLGIDYRFRHVRSDGRQSGTDEAKLDTFFV